jgi:hypothetical protein
MEGKGEGLLQAVESACTAEARDAMGMNALDIVDSHGADYPDIVGEEDTGGSEQGGYGPAPPAKLCHAQTTEDTCMKHAECTWCKCSAVPSKCYTRDESKKLPPSIFKCDP